ncbi:serine/threonine protein kinase [Elizabethkingia anophelis]|uniref:Serine/threonine protein kinase n=1 Tax=Elizabethkingia anophelis R26 TaxID=1246994 RepID=A0ABM6MUQ4_9FLAO|nr:serine/threonine-protein kinase [Elizabethkingia anophelis]ATC36923.1 serine/threonine protein kinase [Elizabethkingia anophelis R26]ATC40601.1 serine/threonine protein kinase [Elizabethkingia anophelis Ag1]ATC44279.1 serine/threonine protein kinase [Elizabethkingia anophelis]ATC47955.1 serine/threonine protein kinase [Elizabethkingia anophelis]ELR80085.1 serine/threonine protein kinase [Elizabethkingia anophelis R26]
MPLGLHTTELNFETTKEIGQEGKNSQVFLAHDKQLDGEIVVKKIEKSKIVNPTEYYEEAKKLYASSHSNVVKVNYGCSDADHIYIAMPYYKNGSLKSLIATKNLTIREIIRYSIQFLSGLHHIHSKGLIHFDVKPDNILISDSDEAHLSDFGLTKAMNSFGFASPELIYEKQVPPETFTSSDKTIHFDIYLAGLTIYRLLNGEEYFHRQLHSFSNQSDYIDAIATGTFPNRTDYLPHIPLKLQRVVNKAMNVNIADRHQTVLELINELSDIDENLDWRFNQTSTSYHWERDNGNHTYKVVVDLTNPRNISILTTKVNNSTVREQREKAHCHNNLTTSNVLSKIKQALKL